jgi:hypothetical protein
MRGRERDRQVFDLCYRGEIGDLIEVKIVVAGPQSMQGERPQRAA